MATKPIIKLIKNPRITEKASYLYENGVYIFDVTFNANKTEIKKAIFDLYKVKPVKVNVINMAPDITHMRGRKSLKQRGKKAVVYLKKGDKIEFV